MRKVEVTLHSDGRRPARPAVNVKVHRYSPPEDNALEAWAEKHLTDEERADVWEWACRDGWDWLQEDAREIWGKGAEVYAEGRSGGWAIVEGLPPFEAWDAVDLARWSRFARVARSLADDTPWRYWERIADLRDEWKAEQDAAFIEAALENPMVAGTVPA